MASKNLLDFKSLVSDATSSLCGGFINSLLKFPATFYTWLASVAETGGDIRGVAKIGDYRFSASPLLEDDYWKLANGQAISRTTYADLFTLIGVIYGVGDGVNTFNLPDMGAKSPIGVGTLPSGAAVAIGADVGEELHVLTAAEGGMNEDHTHAAGRYFSDSGGDENDIVLPTGSLNDADAPTGIGRRNDGGGAGSETADLEVIDGSYPTTTNPREKLSDDDDAFAGHNTIGPSLGCYVYVRIL